MLVDGCAYYIALSSTSCAIYPVGHLIQLSRRLCSHSWRESVAYPLVGGARYLAYQLVSLVSPRTSSDFEEESNNLNLLIFHFQFHVFSRIWAVSDLSHVERLGRSDPVVWMAHSWKSRISPIHNIIYVFNRISFSGLSNPFLYRIPFSPPKVMYCSPMFPRHGGGSTRLQHMFSLSAWI